MRYTRCRYCGACDDDELQRPCSSGEHEVMTVEVNAQRCREVAQTLNPDELLQVLEDALNLGKGTQLGRAILARFPRWHRTLQQLATKDLALPMVHVMSRVEYPDARNEASVGIARKMVGAAPPPWALPFI